MIDLEDELDLDLARKKAKRPPDKWRPWFYAVRNVMGRCRQCNKKRHIKMGHFHSHCAVFPTKDTADTWGLEVEDLSNKKEGLNIRFVDSYPEGEGPQGSDE